MTEFNGHIFYCGRCFEELVPHESGIGLGYCPSGCLP